MMLLILTFLLCSCVNTILFSSKGSTLNTQVEISNVIIKKEYLVFRFNDDQKFVHEKLKLFLIFYFIKNYLL